MQQQPFPCTDDLTEVRGLSCERVGVAFPEINAHDLHRIHQTNAVDVWGEGGALTRAEPERLGDVPFEAVLITLFERRQRLYVFSHGEPVVHAREGLGVFETELILEREKIREQRRDLLVLRAIDMEEETRLQDHLLGNLQLTRGLDGLLQRFGGFPFGKHLLDGILLRAQRRFWRRPFLGDERRGS